MWTDDWPGCHRRGLGPRALFIVDLDWPVAEKPQRSVFDAGTFPGFTVLHLTVA